LATTIAQAAGAESHPRTSATGIIGPTTGTRVSPWTSDRTCGFISIKAGFLSITAERIKAVQRSRRRARLD
jgi:hypothetical protein